MRTSFFQELKTNGIPDFSNSREPHARGAAQRRFAEGGARGTASVPFEKKVASLREKIPEKFPKNS
jgi:hypothetical protein